MYHLRLTTYNKVNFIADCTLADNICEGGVRLWLCAHTKEMEDIGR